MLAKIPYKTVLFSTLWLMLILNLGQVLYTLFFSGHIIYDDIEHLRAAFFVSLGDVPYRDFFEHHHPLLWYILAPIIRFFPKDTVTAVYIGRSISLGVSLLGGYFVYKIEKRFIGGKICALFCLTLYFWGINGISSAGLWHIKPDIYQRCCFFIGLYYLFCYFRYKKFRDLQICALLFTIAFLFLQTTIFFVAPLAIPVCYFLYKNPGKWSDFTKAAVLPLVILAACITVFWKFGMLKDYYESNWLLNQIFSSIWAENTHSSTKFSAIADLFIIANIAIVYLIAKKKINIYLLALISAFGFEFLCRTAFVSPVSYYLTLFVIYAAILAAPFLAKISLKYKEVLLLYLMLGALHLYCNFAFIDQKFFDEVKKYITQTGGEAIRSQYFAERPAYYWMLPYTESVHDMFFRQDASYNLEKIYRQRNALILLYPTMTEEGDYSTLYNSLKPNPEQNRILRNHLVDDFVNENYEKIEPFIYRRKDTLPTQPQEQQ